MTSVLLQVPTRHRISSKLTTPFTQIIISDVPSLSFIDTTLSTKLILCDWRNYANSVPTNSKTMAGELSVHYTYYSVCPRRTFIPIHFSTNLEQIRMATIRRFCREFENHVASSPIPLPPPSPHALISVNTRSQFPSQRSFCEA